MKICTIDECPKPVLARGWCRTHYTRWYETGSTELGIRKGAPPKYKPVAERFWARVTKTDSCWLFKGGNTRLGYGSMSVSGKRQMAHRISYEMLVGPIPDGYHIDHLCRNPPCVNPEHLEPVTPQENTARGRAGAAAKERAALITHCRNGHEYNEANTHINKMGGRMCRTCIRIRQRAQRAARREGVPYVDPFLVARSA